ncbi:MAG: glycoside hydrolase family 43 protein [Bacilli bacterium]
MTIKDIYMRDPFVFVENGTAYLIGTSDENIWSGKADSFLGYKSTDLVNFEGPYVLFKNTDDFWADENFWAPELHKIDGKYYIFASFKNVDRPRASQALVASTPFGKYTPLAKPFTPKDWECLDATYFEENGRKYSIFCREWLQVHDGEICVGELNDDLTELKNIKKLFKASDAQWAQYFYNGDDKNKKYVTDGPFIYQCENGRLLMLWSSNGKEGYALGVAYSDNGILGEWKQLEEPLFKDDGGHGMIFSFQGKKYLILHTSNKTPLSERPYLIEVIEENNMIKIK